MEKTLEQRIAELEKRVAELERQVQAQPEKNVTKEEQELINVNKLRSKYGLKPIPGGDIDLIPIK